MKATISIFTVTTFNDKVTCHFAFSKKAIPSPSEKKIQPQLVSTFCDQASGEGPGLRKDSSSAL